MILRFLYAVVIGIFIWFSIPAAGRAQSDDFAALNQQVVQFHRLGKYAEATEVAKRALALAEKAFGPDHPNVGKSLNNLAALHDSQGRYAEVEPLYKRAVSIFEKAFGPDHPNVGTSLNNLALLYQAQGRYAEAEPLYKRGLAISEKALGADHADVASTLNNLAALYRVQARYAEAERLYKRDLAISEKAFGPDHSDVSRTLNNLAALYESQGRYAEAEPLYKRDLAISEKALGPDHPNVGTSLNNLAALYESQGRWQEATDHYRRGTALIARRTRRGTEIIGRSLTGKRKSEAARLNLVFAGLIKSAYRLKRRDDKAIRSEMFQAAQWAAGSDAAASLAKMAARQATGNARLATLVRERQDLVDEWQKRVAARGAAVAKAPDKRNLEQEEKNVARLAEIDQRISEIDKRLGADFPDYAALANPEPSGIADIQEHLKTNEALVLFLDTAEAKPTPEETFIWVVTKTESRWVRSDLGSKALRENVDALRCGLDSDGAWSGASAVRCSKLLNQIYTEEDQEAGKPLPFDLNRAHALYEALFGRVAGLIKGKDLLVVPSGPLTQLPFQVLVTEKPVQTDLTRGSFAKAAWLTKKHAITMLPSVSSLKALRAHAKSSKASQPFIGFGNPLLNGDPQDQWHQAAAKLAKSIKGCAGSEPVRAAQLRVARRAVLPLERGSRPADLTAVRAAAALPETADELCVVARSAEAQEGDVYLGQRATEANIKSLSDTGKLATYKVLHFATHGALAGEMKGSAEPGLILTPPTDATTNDDGYLSASDVAGLKLDADWVILSACNTAGGETKNAEALSGLAKAFFYAGARSLLVSHWYVDSQATVALVTKAFDALKRDAEIGRAGALRHAMLELLRSGERTWHPSYWAPFVVVGEGAG